MTMSQPGGAPDLPLTSRIGIGIVAATGLGMMVGVGVVLLYTLGVFMPAIAADTGWSRSGIAAAAAPALLIVGLCGPLVGLLVDRYGPRRVLLAGVIGQALGLVLLGLATPTLGSFALFYALAALLGAAQAHIPYSFAIAAWFQRRRGTAAGIGFGLAGVGVGVLPVVSRLLVDGYGWRMAFVALAAIVAAVALPPIYLLMKDPPVERPTPVAAAAPSRSITDVLCGPWFWLLALAFTANAFSASAGSVSLPAMLSEIGVSPVRAAAAMAAVGSSLIVGRVIAGFALDRFPPYRVAVVTFLLPALGYLLASVSTGAGGIIVAGICFGAALGAEGDLMTYLLARRSSMATFGRLFGIVYVGYSMALGFGPAGLVLLTDGLGRDAAFAMIATCAIIGAVAAGLASRAVKGSVAKIVKLEHAWRRLDGRNDDGFQVAPFPG